MYKEIPSKLVEYLNIYTKYAIFTVLFHCYNEGIKEVLLTWNTICMRPLGGTMTRLVLGTYFVNTF